MLKKLTIFIIVIIGVLLLLFAGVTVPVSVSTTQGDDALAQLPYALRGSYTVGIQEHEMDNENSLSITMWYPASNQENQSENLSYAYPLKMGEDFMVNFATYRGQAIENAPYLLSDNPYPLVILSPGFAMGAAAYGWLAEHLASHGFVVIAPEHQEHFDGELNGLWQSPITRPQDIVDVLAYVDEQVIAGGAFNGLIDSETVAVIGHSYGGYTTLASAGAQIDSDYLREHCQSAQDENHPTAWICDEIIPYIPDMADLAGLDSVPDGLWQLPVDPRIDAIVPMAGDAFFFGDDGLAEIDIPVMAIGGTADHDSPFDWSSQMSFDYTSSERKILIGLDDAEHMIFTGSCEAIPVLLRFISGEFCEDGDWNRYDAHHLIAHYTTAFLLAELQNDASATNALTTDNSALPGIIYTVEGY